MRATADVRRPPMLVVCTWVPVVEPRARAGDGQCDRAEARCIHPIHPARGVARKVTQHHTKNTLIVESFILLPPSPACAGAAPRRTTGRRAQQRCVSPPSRPPPAFLASKSRIACREACSTQAVVGPLLAEHAGGPAPATQPWHPVGCCGRYAPVQPPHPPAGDDVTIRRRHRARSAQAVDGCWFGPVPPRYCGIFAWGEGGRVAHGPSGLAWPAQPAR